MRPAYRRVDSCAAEVEAGSSYLYSTWGERDEVAAGGAACDRRPRRGPEPNRPGDRVRLLLRPRRPDVPRPRVRRGHGQLQPRDRLDRLRHVRPPLLRADARGGAGICARGARTASSSSSGSNPAQARARHRVEEVADPRDALRRRRPGGGSRRALRGPVRRSRHPGPGLGDRRRRGQRRRARRTHRLPGSRATLVRPRRPAMRVCYESPTRWRRVRGRGTRARRPLPRGRGRDRRRRSLRRTGHVRRGGDAARRGGRRSLRRLLLRPPGAGTHHRYLGGFATQYDGSVAHSASSVSSTSNSHSSTSQLFVLEANPRASRTVPFASKAIGVNLVHAACKVMTERRSRALLPPEGSAAQVSVKAAVFPFARFPGADPVLGPDALHGEVMATAADFHRPSPRPSVRRAGRCATGPRLSLRARRRQERSRPPRPPAGRPRVRARARPRTAMRSLLAGRSQGQARCARSPSRRGATVVDLIRRRRCDLVVNTPAGGGARSDGYLIREAALAARNVVHPRPAGAFAAVEAIALARRGGALSLQEKHAASSA